jgi:hypothetical protein
MEAAGVESRNRPICEQLGPFRVARIAQIAQRLEWTYKSGTRTLGDGFMEEPVTNDSSGATVEQFVRERQAELVWIEDGERPASAPTINSGKDGNRR